MNSTDVIIVKLKHIIVDLEDIKNYSTQDVIDKNLLVAITALKNIIQNI